MWSTVCWARTVTCCKQDLQKSQSNGNFRGSFRTYKWHQLDTDRRRLNVRYRRKWTFIIDPTHPTPVATDPTPPLDCVKIVPPLPQSAPLPGVPASVVPSYWVPSPPHTPPLYRDFRGSPKTPSGELVELECLSRINDAIFCISYSGKHARVDLAGQQP